MVNENMEYVIRYQQIIQIESDTLTNSLLLSFCYSLFAYNYYYFIDRMSCGLFVLLKANFRFDIIIPSTRVCGRSVQPYIQTSEIDWQPRQRDNDDYVVNNIDKHKTQMFIFANLQILSLFKLAYVYPRDAVHARCAWRPKWLNLCVCVWMPHHYYYVLFY